MSSRQTNIFSNLKKFKSRNDDNDSIHDKRRQPSISSSKSSMSSNSIQHSSSLHTLDTKLSVINSPPSPGRNSNYGSASLTYKEINALSDMKPIPTLKSNHNSTLSNYQQVKMSSPRTHSTSSHSSPHISHPTPLSSNATEFSMKMPDDPSEIERRFADLMTKRDFQSLPQKAKDEMHNYSAQKKWMLVYQDALGDYQKRERRNKQGEESVTPEFYVKKLIDKTITLKQLNNLWVSLRTEHVGWVQKFIDLQGEIVLSNVLSQLHTKSRHYSLSADEMLEREFALVKCLKSILNVSAGADIAISSQSCVPAIAPTLLSPRLPTRKSVTEMLIFLAHWKSPEGYRQVMKGIDSLSSDNVYQYVKGMDKYYSGRKKDKPSSSRKPRRFEEWFKIVSETLDGRGKMGSLVGASEEYKQGGQNGEAQLVEYIYATVLMINSVAKGGEDFRARCHIRAQLKAIGLNRLMKRFQDLGSVQIDAAIKDYEESAAADYESLVRADRVGSNVDMNDPISLVNQVWHKVKGSEAEGYFLSTLQHMFLAQADPMKANDSKELSSSFRLIDGIVSGVSMHNTSSDEEASMNIAIQRLYAGLQSDEMARRAIQEAKVAAKRAEAAKAERDELAKQLSMGANGMLEKLTRELSEQEIVLRRQKKMNEQLSSELDELKQTHLHEKQAQELEMRELFVAINGTTPASEEEGYKNEILSEIQRKLAEKRDGVRKQSNIWNKKVEPNAKLRSLRDKMDDLGRQARELEMADFESGPPIAFSSPVPSQQLPTIPRAARDDDLDKLAKLKKKLESLQQDSNDIIKYSSDERFAEIMNQKKYMAFDRLNQLNNSFKDFNIDFDIPETPDNKRMSVTPDYRNKLKEEYKQVALLKEELLKQVQKFESTNAANEAAENSAILEKLENKYIGGKKEQPTTDDVVSEGTVVNDVKQSSESSSAFKPVLAEIITKGIAKNSNSVAVNGTVEEESELGEKQDSLAPPAETVLSKVDTTPVAKSPAPPPPPLPKNMAEMTPVSKSSAPPAPPLPMLLSPKSPPFSATSPVPPPLPPGSSKFSSIALTMGISDPFINYPRPKRKLKQLHWEKLDSTENSVWDGISGETFANDLLDKGIFDEMEDMFAAREAKKLAAKKSVGANKLTFLARDVNQQFGINLHAFSSLSDDQTVEKILSCDDSVIENLNILEFLRKPEIVQIPNNLARDLEPYSTDWSHGSDKKPDKDPNELQRADRIYLETVYNLQHYWSSRMRALVVITTFEKDYSALVAKLQSIDSAVEAIQNSDNIRYVFNIILAFGNYMNDAGKQAKGFKLSTLQRLSFMKDDKNSMTFLHYVEKIIRQVYPQFEDFLEELKPVLPVAKYSIEVIENDCKDYTSGIKNVEDSLEIGNLSDPTLFHPKDKILATVLPSLPDARRKSELLAEQAKIILNGFNRLMAFFGENTSDNFARNSFFSKFNNFILEYQKARQENLKREEELRIYEQRKLQLEKSMSEKQKRAENGEVEGNAVMDNLLEKLKKVGPSKGDPSSARRKALARKKLMEARKNIMDISSLSGLGINTDDSADDTQDSLNLSLADHSIKDEDEDNEHSDGTESRSNDSNKDSNGDHSNNSSTNASNTGESTVDDDEEVIVEGDDVGARARNLLKSLRGSDVSPSMGSEGMTAAQQLRKQKRLERLQKQQNDESPVITSDDGDDNPH